MRTSIVPAASSERIERFVLAMTPAELRVLTTEGSKESGDLSARLMQAALATDLPATEQSVREALFYAVAVMMMRRSRLEWADEDKRASAQTR